MIREASRPRRLRRRLLVLVGLVAAMGAWYGYQVTLPAYAEDVVRAKLRAWGLAQARFRLDDATLRETRLADVRLGRDFTVERVQIAYDPLTLLRDRVDSITLEGVDWRVAPNERALRASVPGRLAMQSAGSGDARGGAGQPPVRRVRVADGRVTVEGDDGSVDVPLEGTWTARRGSMRLSLESPLAQGTVRLQATRGSDERGRARMALSARGDFARVLAGTPIALRDTRVDGVVRLEGKRVAALDLKARAGAVSVHGHGLGPVVLRAGRRAERLRWRVRGERGDLSASVRGTLPVDVRTWVQLRQLPMRWRVRGTLPAELLRHVADVELSGKATLDARGEATVRWGGARQPPQLSFNGVRLVADVQQLTHTLGLRLQNLHADMRVQGHVTPEAAHVRIRPGSRWTLGSARAGGRVWARGLRLRPELSVRAGGEGVRVETDDELLLRARALSVVEGSETLHLGRISVRAAPRAGRSLVAHHAGRTQLAATVRARVARLGGSTSGRGVRLRGDVDAVFDPHGRRVEAPVRLFAEVLRPPGADLVLEDVRVRLPVSLEGEHGAPSGDARWALAGRLRAHSMSWRGIDLCTVAGGFRLTAGGLAGRLQCPVGERTTARLSARLPYDGGGHIDVTVPRSKVRPGQPLGRLLAELVGVRIEGTMGMQMRIVPGLPAVALRLGWTRAERGRVRVGPGQAKVRFGPDGTVRVEALATRLAGGRIRVAPFTVDRARSEVALELTLRQLRVGKLLRTLSDGRATGRGRLDGHLAFRLDHGEHPSVRLDSGRLHVPDGGRIRIRDPGLVRSVKRTLPEGKYSQLVKKRIAGALADFEYTRLAMAVRERKGIDRVTAHVRGQGARVPQELDVTLNLFGAEHVLDALHLWPSTGLRLSWNTNAK